MIRGFARGLFLVTLTVSAASTARSQQPSASPPTPSTSTALPLLPGDAIQIGSWREPELRGDFHIDETGSVILPLLGKLRVTGIPADELKQRIVAAYSEQVKNQEIQVTALRRVSVLGAVRTPGVYLVDPTIGLSEVVAMAGGATREGKADALQIRRGSRLIRSSAYDADPDILQLASGDEIIVPERSWFARNGQYVLGGALSVLAIFAARTF